jgi:hypothetical protein
MVLRMSEAISTLSTICNSRLVQTPYFKEGARAKVRPSMLTAGHTRRSHPLELFSDSDRSTLGGRGSPTRQAPFLLQRV